MRTHQQRNFRITLDNWSHEKLILRRCEEQRHTSLKRWGTFTFVPPDPLLWEPSIPRYVAPPWGETAGLGEQVYWCLSCVRTGQCGRCMSSSIVWYTFDKWETGRFPSCLFTWRDGWCLKLRQGSTSFTHQSKVALLGSFSYGDAVRRPSASPEWNSIFRVAEDFLSSHVGSCSPVKISSFHCKHETSGKCADTFPVTS